RPGSTRSSWGSRCRGCSRRSPWCRCSRGDHMETAVWVRALVACVAFFFAAGGVPAEAASLFARPGAFVLLFNTSIRAAGRGGAAAAVGWGEPGAWANPASLAGVHGLSWQQSYTRVFPKVDDHVKFTSRQLLLGGEGLGVSLMGEPFPGVGRTRLDFG